jgi:hypothetical protein
MYNGWMKLGHFVVKDGIYTVFEAFPEACISLFLVEYYLRVFCGYSMGIQCYVRVIAMLRIWAVLGVWG